MYFIVPNNRTVDNESYLVLAIKHQLQSLVKCLCEKGVELGTPDTSGNVPLWVALRSKQENIASMLVCNVAIENHIYVHTCVYCCIVNICDPIHTHVLYILCTVELV